MSLLCPVCKCEARTAPLRDPGDAKCIVCQRCCGSDRAYLIGGSYSSERDHSTVPLPRLSAALRHAFEEGKPLPILTSFSAMDLMEQAPKSTESIAMHLLKAIARRADHRPGQENVLRYEIDYSLAYASDAKEFQFYLDHLDKKGWIVVKHDESTASCTPTVAGLVEVEKAGG
jgi:hypothetical protein